MSISSSITVPSQRAAKASKLGKDSEYIQLHFNNAAQNLETVFLNNTSASFEEAADLIIKARRRYIVASRGNACLGDYFLLYLKHMLPNVETTASSSISPIDHICSITKDDCLIVFSFPRYSSVDRSAVEMAREAGARIVLLTDKPSALLAPYASAMITVPVDSSTFFNSMVAPQFAAEILLDVISRKGKGIEKRLKKIDRYLEELGNY